MFGLFNGTRSGSLIVSIALVGIGSFFIGGLFVYNILFEKTITQEITLTPVGVHTELMPEILEELEEEEIAEDGVYASVRGTKYYPRDCRAGNSLSKANIIWFKNAEEAESAGYTISKSC